MIHYQNIEAAKAFYGRAYQPRFALRPGVEIGLKRDAILCAALADQFFGQRARPLVAEGNFRSSLGKQTDTGCADTARTAGDQRHFSLQIKCDGHNSFSCEL